MEIILRHTTGIAFYDSVRFDEHVVVYNSCEDGTWGNEERSELMPFKRGEPMQVGIHMTCNVYFVEMDYVVMTVNTLVNDYIIDFR